MSSQPDVSIIIPVFNVEKHIGATLESTLLQKKISVEVLVVDDGSTDTTPAIIKHYAQKYTCIRLLNNEKTKGVSGARNTALQHMRGKACFFLDGDDILPPEALLPLVECMQKNNAQLVKGALAYLCFQRNLYIPLPLVRNEGKDDYPSGGFFQYLYDANFIKANQCSFPETYTRGEDCVFFCQVFCKEPLTFYTDNTMYLYRINHKAFEPSAMHALFFMKHFLKIKALLHAEKKEQFYVSYLQSHFCKIWLDHAYGPLREGLQASEVFLETCCQVLSGFEDKIGPFLQEDVKQHTEAFLTACKNKDIEAMYTILTQELPFTKPSKYMGINNECHKKYWPIIKFFHKVKNILTTPQGGKYFFYIHSLEHRAKKFTTC